jgi:hypothetical protein
MIISPPFLPARATGVTDEAWINAAMPPAIRLTGTGAPEGSFPLSNNLGWHNGMHIAAPANQAVRAIADGKVIFAGKPNAVKTDVTDPQNYNPFDADFSKPTAAWTDNGCIILEHKTEIGAQGATATEVTYYSLYMHLSDLARITPAGQTTKRQLQAGDNVWRKDEIGSTGQIYGNAGQIHFEICMNAANLQSLIGRAPAWTAPATATASIPAPTADGRTDSVFGSLYFYLPAATPTATTPAMPTTHLRGTAAPTTTLGSPMWVKMDYSAGHCTFTSYNASGTLINALGAETDAEYNLYKNSLERHNTLSATEKATSSPSGWYELLRFGRNIGRGTADTDKDLLPATAAHWRKIANPAGTAVWADLNCTGSFKFSDADFLALNGWNCVNDDTSPADQRCDSDNLKNLIRDPDDTNTKRMEVGELSKRLGVADVQTKLKRTICQFPTEWDKATVSTRYNFVQELDNFKAAAANGAWPKLEAHLKAITFDGLPAGYTGADWRFHPKEFIRVMRLCGWLSRKEMLQLIPVDIIRKPGSHTSAKQAIWEAPSLATARTFLNTHALSLNNALRKFTINTPSRQACFFGNSTQETGWFSSLKESGGNDATLHDGWYGRGFLQLTNPDGNINGGNNNYYKYFEFIGHSPITPPGQNELTWRNLVGTDSNHASHSACAYWVWPNKASPTKKNPSTPQVDSASKYADIHSENQRNTISTQKGFKTWYYNQSFTNTAAAVNYPGSVGRSPPNMNGLVDRSVAYINAMIVLSDMPQFPDANNQLVDTPENFTRRKI